MKRKLLTILLLLTIAIPLYSFAEEIEYELYLDIDEHESEYIGGSYSRDFTFYMQYDYHIDFDDSKLEVYNIEGNNFIEYDYDSHKISPINKGESKIYLREKETENYVIIICNVLNLTDEFNKLGDKIVFPFSSKYYNDWFVYIYISKYFNPSGVYFNYYPESKSIDYFIIEDNIIKTCQVIFINEVEDNNYATEYEKEAERIVDNIEDITYTYYFAENSDYKMFNEYFEYLFIDNNNFNLSSLPLGGSGDDAGGTVEYAIFIEKDGIIYAIKDIFMQFYSLEYYDDLQYSHLNWGLENYTYTYTGEDIKPKIIVNADLKENVDYTISYKNNIELGTGSIIIKGINKILSEKEIYFNIVNDLVIDNNSVENISNNIINRNDNFLLISKTGDTFEEILNKFKIIGNVLYQFVNQLDEVIQNSKVKTGDRIQFLSNDELSIYEITIKSDVNGDGAVTPLDYIDIKNHIMGKTLINGEAYLEAADANSDGDITPLDYIEVKLYIMGDN